MAFLDKSEFLELTGFKLEVINEESINFALEYAANKIRSVLFVHKVYEFTSPNDKFQLETPLADYNGDGVVDENDIFVYELDDNNFIDPEIDRKSKIIGFNAKYGRVYLDALYPKENRKLVIESYTARFPNEEMQGNLKRLMLLISSDYLFNTIPISRLQDGINSWNLNGVSITFNIDSIARIKEAIKKEIDLIYNYCKPLLSFKTDFGFSNDDLIYKRGFNVRSPSGVVYKRI